MRLRIDRLSIKEYEGDKGPYKIKWIKSGEEWYSAYEGKWNQDWVEGHVIEDPVVVEKKKGDKTYKNIKAPHAAHAAPADDTLYKRISELEKRVSSLESWAGASGKPEEDLPF